MIEDAFVIDGVTHCLGVDPESPPEVLNYFFSMLYPMLHQGMGSRDPKYMLTPEQFNRTRDPLEFASCLFAESQTDMACYHALGYGVLAPNMSTPIESAVTAQEAAPGRILIYAGCSGVGEVSRSIDHIDQQIEEHGAIGLKFYPLVYHEGSMVPFRLDTEDVAFPLIEHAQRRGLRSVGIHKALGPVLSTTGMGDLEKPAMAFPGMNFEIVHGGMAFLEETALLMELPNVWVTLESTTSYLHFAPRRFAEVIGRLCASQFGLGGSEDRVIWSTAASFVHPQPFIEKFWNFEMPQDLVEEYGYPVLTNEIKRKILGENFARLHGLDIDTLKAQIPNDEMRQRQLVGDLAEPWSKTPALVS